MGVGGLSAFWGDSLPMPVFYLEGLTLTEGNTFGLYYL